MPIAEWVPSTTPGTDRIEDLLQSQNAFFDSKSLLVYPGTRRDQSVKNVDVPEAISNVTPTLLEQDDNFDPRG